ncbi:hypothetical protein DFH06DRAFT_1298753 [Mycena polygramma]|nr:hypothetical protein DFH06DRAFT_1298753 [Mycena polygramma]
MPGRSIFVFLNLKSAPALNQTKREAVGAVKVIVQSGHINGPNWLGRAPNPFVSICASGTKVTTDPQPATYDPSWITQTFFLLVKSPNEVIRMKVYDHHEHRKHNALLGEASFDMSRLIESGMELDAHLALLKQNKRIGDLLCSLFYFPITLPLGNETAHLGNIKTLVLSAWSYIGRKIYVQPRRSCRLSIAIANIRLRWDGPSIHVTPRGKIFENGSVVWESTHEFLCFNKSDCVVYVEVLEPDLEDPLGHVSICLTDLVEATIARRGRWPLSGSAAGKLVAFAEWKPLDIELNR